LEFRVKEEDNIISRRRRSRRRRHREGEGERERGEGDIGLVVSFLL